MGNRVTTAAARIALKFDALDPGTAAKLDANMALDFTEHYAYQEAQSRAHVEQLLTTDEAQTVYIALGEIGDPANGGWAEGTTTPMKIAVTKLIGELLDRRIRQHDATRAAA